MLTFKQFILFEHSFDNFIYHATTKNFKPDKIASGSHFGTIHAAKMMGFHSTGIFDDKKDTKIHAYSYKPKGKIVDVEDHWDDDKPDTYIKSQISTNKNHPIALRKDAASAMSLPDISKKHNISAYRYKNNHEHEGSQSYIIHDKEGLKHEHTFNNMNYLNRYKKLSGLDKLGSIAQKSKRLKPDNL